VLRRFAVLLCSSLLAGCVSSGDVKLASAEVTSTLEELDQSVVSFQELLEAEVRAIKDNVGQAIIARIVKTHIDEFVAGTGQAAAPGCEAKPPGLIAVAQEIESTRQAAVAYVAQLDAEAKKLTVEDVAAQKASKVSAEAKEPTTKNVAANTVSKLLAKQKKEQEAQAKRLDAGGSKCEAAKLHMRAEKEPDAVLVDYSTTYVELSMIPKDVEDGLDGLKAVLEVLSETHAAVDGWIATDVTVSGKTVAETLNKYLPQPASDEEGK